MRSSPLVKRYGTLWARSDKNINRVPPNADGVYVLFDGSLPMYAGKGHIQDRIAKAKRSKSRGQLWDRFSWYEVRRKNLTHDIEVLILRILPPSLRALTKQDGHFIGGQRMSIEKEGDKPDSITRKVVRLRKNQAKK